ncbi:MAG: tetratricopeptide repeat protein, partial [bacterium]
WGMWPAGHRLPNLLAHLGVVMLLYRFLLNLGTRGDVALAAGVVFALHPIHSENLFCAYFRRDSVAALCVLAGVMACRRWGIGTPFLTSPAAWASLLSLMVGLGFKEGAGLLLPLVWVHDRLGLHPGGGRPPATRYAPLAIALLGYAALRLWVLPVQALPQPSLAATWAGELGVNLLTFPKSLVTYARLAVWPWPLVTNHGIAPAFAVEPGVLGGCLLLGGYAWLLLRTWRTQPLVAFGLVWMGLTYLPTANLVPGLVAQRVAERYAYLPSVGAGLALAAWIARRPPERLQRWRPALVVALCGYVVITLMRGGEWRDAERLVALDISRDPGSYLARYNRGVQLHREGRLEEARAAYRQALRVDPGGLMAHNNLGDVSLSLHDLETARAEFDWVRRHNPGEPGAYLNLGNVALLSKQYRLAEAYYRQALALNPGFEDARAMLEQVSHRR